jgi:cobalamin biosynthesis Co2+ chelatase CbiK
MKHNELKELIRQVVKEQSDYNKLFAHMLTRTHKDINDMSSKEKEKFFNAVDKAWKAKNEGKLTGLPEELTDKQKELDVDGDGEIEGSDLAALRNKK